MKNKYWNAQAVSVIYIDNSFELNTFRLTRLVYEKENTKRYNHNMQY